MQLRECATGLGQNNLKRELSNGIASPVPGATFLSMEESEAPAKRGPGHRITAANVREMALRAAEAKRQRRHAREARAEELKALASLAPRERLRLELPEHFAVALERLAEVLNGPDPEAALNQF